MFLLLSVIVICITVIIVVFLLQGTPITINIHKKIEEVRPKPTALTDEEKKILEEQKQVTDGMNEVIKFAQEFLGGDTDAEPKREAE